MTIKRLFIYLLITSVAVSALLGIGVILFGTFGEFEGKVLMTTFTVTWTSILGLACGALFETGRARSLPLAGIGFSIVSAALCIFLIWFGEHSVDAVWKSAASTAMIATVCGHLSLISLANLDKRFQWSRQILYVCVSILVTLLLWILWFEPDSNSDVVTRIIGVLAILIAALTVVTPVLHKLSHHELRDNEIDLEIASLRSRLAELEAQKGKLAAQSDL